MHKSLRANFKGISKKPYTLVFNRGIRLYLLFKFYGKWLLLYTGVRYMKCMQAQQNKTCVQVNHKRRRIY